jgi:hypothetical protein
MALDTVEMDIFNFLAMSFIVAGLFMMALLEVKLNQM